MKPFNQSHAGFVWLELLFFLAFLVLLLQFFPSLLAVLDARNWSRLTWFVFNAVAVVALVIVRFGPDLYASWSQRRDSIAVERAKLKKQQELREQRETLERLQHGRARRIY